MPTRLVSLFVVVEDNDWAPVFQDFSELATNLGEVHEFVRVQSTQVDEELPEDEPCELEHLGYDERTLDKVRRSLTMVLEASQAGVNRPVDDIVTDCIGYMQNAGILFRERR